MSPVLVNLFMHSAFDRWLSREFPMVEFERSADDVVVHCATQRQARRVLTAIAARWRKSGCDCTRTRPSSSTARTLDLLGSHEHTSFTFLGYEFRPRAVKGKNGKIFTSFSPAISPKALTAIGQVVRRWRIHLWTGRNLAELAEQINPVVAGWINYYGRFGRPELYPLLQRINTYLLHWAARKYKRLRAWKRRKQWWLRVIDRDPKSFAHWAVARTSIGYG